MAKETYYFSHDYHARSDEKMNDLIMSLGMEGVGIYWCLVEMLYENEGYLKLSKCESYAFALHTQCDKIKRVITEFDLFVIEGDEFYSESALERLSKRKEKSKKASESANTRWKNANGMRSHGDRNAIKEKKVKEKKVKNTVIPFSSFWDSYGKKVGDKTKLEKKWNKLSDEDRKAIMDYIPAYIKATPDKKYRKNPETFLNNHSWNDEIVEYAHKPGPPDLRELAISKVESNVKAMITHPERFNKYNPFDDAAQSIISHLPDVKGFDYTGLKYVLINLIETKYREDVKNAVKGIPA